MRPDQLRRLAEEAQAWDDRAAFAAKERCWDEYNVFAVEAARVRVRLETEQMKENGRDKR